MANTTNIHIHDSYARLEASAFRLQLEVDSLKTELTTAKDTAERYGNTIDALEDKNAELEKQLATAIGERESLRRQIWMR